MLPLGDGCISNCSGCGEFKEKKMLYEESKILRNLSRILDINCTGDHFFISNSDFFLLEKRYINEIVIRIEKRQKKIIFHSDLSTINMELLPFLSLPLIKLLFQRNLDITSIKSMISSIPLLISSNIEYMFWVYSYKDNSLYNWFIEKLYKLGFEKISFSDYILGSLKVRILQHAGGGRLDRKGCIVHKGYYVSEKEITIDNAVFFPSYFEVNIDGFIRLHEPPCGAGDLRISNIYKEKIDILSDFRIFEKYIGEFIQDCSDLPQKDICNICKKKPFICI